MPISECSSMGIALPCGTRCWKHWPNEGNLQHSLLTNLGTAVTTLVLLALAVSRLFLGMFPPAPYTTIYDQVTWVILCLCILSELEASPLQASSSPANNVPINYQRCFMRKMRQTFALDSSNSSLVSKLNDYMIYLKALVTDTYADLLWSSEILYAPP